jgi:hypothetical protein
MHVHTGHGRTRGASCFDVPPLGDWLVSLNCTWVANWMH